MRLTEQIAKKNTESMEEPSGASPKFEALPRSKVSGDRIEGIPTKVERAGSEAVPQFSDGKPRLWP